MSSGEVLGERSLFSFAAATNGNPACKKTTSGPELLVVIVTKIVSRSVLVSMRSPNIARAVTMGLTASTTNLRRQLHRKEAPFQARSQR